MGIYRLKGMGWLPGYPDFREYTMENLFKVKGNKLSTNDTKVPQTMDLRRLCSPIKDQGKLASATSHAVAGLIEYYERQRYGNMVALSRLFLYKVTRNLLGWSGDSGAFIKTTLSALTTFGVPHEEYWPYTIEDFDKEPPAFCYSLAKNYESLRYYHVDFNLIYDIKLLDQIKEIISYSIPIVFGFSAYNSIEQASDNGMIPLPERNDKIIGGHAVLAIGYDDHIVLSGNPGSTTGAFLIRNSWGTKWGQGGYGWLPYEYLLKGLTKDWWIVNFEEWGLPHKHPNNNGTSFSI